METGIPIEHEFTADAGYASRMTRTLFAYMVSRPRVVVLLILIALITTLGGVVVANSVRFMLVAAVFGLLVGILLDALVLVLTFSMTKRRVQVIAPAGSVYGTGLGETAIRVSAPLSNAEVSYRAFQSVQVRDGFVLLRHRNTRLNTVLPAELFPGDTLDRLRERIAGS